MDLQKLNANRSFRERRKQNENYITNFWFPMFYKEKPKTKHEHEEEQDAENTHTQKTFTNITEETDLFFVLSGN